MNKRIIVVDDYLHELIKGFLVLRGYTNITAYACPYSVLKDIEENTENPPDLIITDFNMFGMNGLEMLQAAKLKNSDVMGIIYTSMNQYVKTLTCEFHVTEKILGGFENLFNTVKEVISNEKEEPYDYNLI